MAKLSDERKEYLKEYRKKNIHRIPLDVSHEFYDRIKAYADDRGKSVNSTIKFCLDYVLHLKGY